MGIEDDRELRPGGGDHLAEALDSVPLVAEDRDDLGIEIPEVGVALLQLDQLVAAGSSPVGPAEDHHDVLLAPVVRQRDLTTVLVRQREVRGPGAE